MPESSKAEFLRNWLIKTTPNPHILIVDDCIGDIEILNYELRKFKCTVESCTKAREAVDKIVTGVFHLVFLDIKLNNGTGPDVVAQTVEKATGTHFVLTSGYLYQEIKNLVDSTAALLFWPKPITPDKLDQILTRRTPNDT